MLVTPQSTIRMSLYLLLSLFTEQAKDRILFNFSITFTLPFSLLLLPPLTSVKNQLCCVFLHIWKRTGSSWVTLSEVPGINLRYALKRKAHGASKEMALCHCDHARLHGKGIILVVNPNAHLENLGSVTNCQIVRLYPLPNT